MNPKINILNSNLTKYREEIVNHALYKKLNSVEDIAVMMEHHVYAVWDFMSLLKALQSLLTCTTSPWKPVGDGKIRQLINSIVLEEESDVDKENNPLSHYEMYIDAMKQCGANTSAIESFVSNVSTTNIPSVNDGVDAFLKTTFDVIESNETHKIASAFTFGREDLIPDMFIAIIEKSNNNQDNKFPQLTYYLNRHIELDGDEHGPLSLEMIAELCGNNENKWNDVLEVSIEALEKRISLWDEIANEIKLR